MLKTFTLKNGLKVATYSIPQMRSAFLGLTVKAGSIFDTPETSGAAHFMEHMLVQGIPSYPNVESLSDFVESVAGSFNASTYNQTVRFNIGAPVAHLKDLLRITSEVFFEPLFPEDALERERRAVLEEIHQRQDALWYKNNQFWSQARFKKGHPLLLDPGGSEESVNLLTREDLLSYWAKFFDPANSYLVVVGGFSDREVKKIIEEFFLKYPSKKKFPGFPKLTNKDLTSRQIKIRTDMELKTCYVSLSFPSISDNFSLKERVNQGSIRSVLGNLRSSRLFRLLRDRRGLVYDVGVSSALYDSFGYANIYCQVASGNLDEVLTLITQELFNFVKSGPTKKELEFAKNYSKNQNLMQFDHPHGIASWIEGDLIWEDKILTPEEYNKIIDQINQKSVLDFMQKHWEFDKLNLVIQGPIPNNKANIKKFSEIVKEIK